MGGLLFFVLLRLIYGALCMLDSHKASFDKIIGYIKKAKDAGAEVLIGGTGKHYSLRDYQLVLNWNHRRWFCWIFRPTHYPVE